MLDCAAEYPQFLTNGSCAYSSGMSRERAQEISEILGRVRRGREERRRCVVNLALYLTALLIWFVVVQWFV